MFGFAMHAVVPQARDNNGTPEAVPPQRWGGSGPPGPATVVALAPGASIPVMRPVRRPPPACHRLLPRSSAVEEAASPPAVQLRSELALQLHQAPDPGAVSADVGLDVGGRRTDGGQVDAEQLRAPR